MEKTAFLNESVNSLSEIYEEINSLEELSFSSLDKKKTCIIIVDMINGFVKEGALKSREMANLIPEVVKLTKLFKEQKMEIVAFADCHPHDSVEFAAYPPHCVAGTTETLVIEELEEVGGFHLISKNSTDGFLEPEFQAYLHAHPQLDTFVIVGGCTDICVLQLSLSLKADFNRRNKKSRIIVPVNGVDTYDLGVHNSNLMQLFALYNLKLNAINVVKEINFER